MALQSPFEQHNFLGAFATEAEATAHAKGEHWDTNHDGSGVPLDTLIHYNTTTTSLWIVSNGEWRKFGSISGTIDETLIFRVSGDPVSSRNYGTFYTFRPRP